MRLGLIGPTESDTAALQRAAELLVSELEADILLYLGTDAIARDFASRHLRPAYQPGLDRRVATVATSGTPAEIEELLDELRRAEHVDRLRVLPEPPARAIEMIDDRIVLAMYARQDVEEEDVVNANLVVYGDGGELAFRRFGAKCLFSPGPLNGGCIGLVEGGEDNGGVTLTALDLEGRVLWVEPVQGRGAKVMVAP